MLPFFKKNKKISLTNDQIAEMLGMSKEAYEQFENAYQEVLSVPIQPENMMQQNTKLAVEECGKEIIVDNKVVDDIINRIVNELIAETSIITINSNGVHFDTLSVNKCEKKVSKNEILALPEDLRPQLTGSMMQKDVKGDTAPTLLYMYEQYQNAKNPVKKKMFYDHFRQGLDILDLDAITYEMIGMNPNSMGYWLPDIAEANTQLFKIPETKIIKVPLPLLQLTRLQYETLTRTTLEIVDQYCQKVFELNPAKDYFVKTGTYSSKYDFRNAFVHGEKEVRELGEYLLYNHHHAISMAGPLMSPCIYGVSTTNEWVVREFVKDVEDNPCIYKGLPLHTEYRVFVDFDTKDILGISPYWEPETMKKAFSRDDDIHNKHDYITYSMHEKTLMDRYHKNKDDVLKKIKQLIGQTEHLTGQWSIDVMQNGEDFYLIDMALAAQSALKECVPEHLLAPVRENWIPDFSQMEREDLER